LLWQVWNKLLSSCYKVDDGNRLATMILQHEVLVKQQEYTFLENTSPWYRASFSCMYVTLVKAKRLNHENEALWPRWRTFRKRVLGLFWCPLSCLWRCFWGFLWT
jgi:hypothetical protein